MKVQPFDLSHWLKADISSRSSCLYWPQASVQTAGEITVKKVGEDRNEAGKRVGLGGVTRSEASDRELHGL